MKKRIVGKLGSITFIGVLRRLEALEKRVGELEKDSIQIRELLLFHKLEEHEPKEECTCKIPAIDRYTGKCMRCEKQGRQSIDPIEEEPKEEDEEMEKDIADLESKLLQHNDWHTLHDEEMEEDKENKEFENKLRYDILLSEIEALKQRYDQHIKAEHIGYDPHEPKEVYEGVHPNACDCAICEPKEEWKGEFAPNLGHDPNNPFPLKKEPKEKWCKDLDIYMSEIGLDGQQMDDMRNWIRETYIVKPDHTELREKIADIIHKDVHGIAHMFKQNFYLSTADEILALIQ